MIYGNMLRITEVEVDLASNISIRVLHPEALLYSIGFEPAPENACVFSSILRMKQLPSMGSMNLNRRAYQDRDFEASFIKFGNNFA